MRLNKEELNKIKEKYNVKELWSFSKFNCYRTSHYEFLLHYIRHLPENNEKQCAYGSLGGAAHDVLERFYNGELKYENLSDEFDDAFMTNIDIAGLYFDRTDSTKNDNIKNKYYKNIMHYFETFTPIKEKALMEQFVTIKITDDIVMQGYIDCIHKDNEGNYIVTDFKTSTIYKGAKKDKEAAQLVLYSEALRQKGIPQDKIKCRWLFLKYVDIDCEQVNGKIKTRNIERYEIGEKLQASAKTWLKKLGYEDNMMEYLDALAQTNDLTVLPEDVRAKYTVRDCEVYVDNIWELYDELKQEIIKTITEINQKTEEYNRLKDTDIEAAEHLFWDSEESLKEQSYYYNNLCGYNTPTIKPYKEYLDKINAEKNGGLLNINKQEDIIPEDDLSWLNGLI